MEDRVLGLLIDIVDSVRPECLQTFIEEFLKTQFGFSSRIIQKVFVYLAGYYNASNIEELNTLLELILFKNKDPLLSVRERIIAEDLIQPEGGVSKFIANYISGILGGKSCVEICHC